LWPVSIVKTRDWEMKNTLAPEGGSGAEPFRFHVGNPKQKASTASVP
jgi:hypothetical protein